MSALRLGPQQDIGKLSRNQLNFDPFKRKQSAQDALSAPPIT
jgi:hypothetical protein